MYTIFKYEIEFKDRTIHSIPEGAHILTVAIQNEVICVWAKVDTSKPKKAHAFIVCGTGNPIPESASHYPYAGTVYDGPFVWHIFHNPLS